MMNLFHPFFKRNSEVPHLTSPRIKSTYIPENALGFNQWQAQLRVQRESAEYFDALKVEFQKFLSEQTNGEEIFESIKRDLLKIRSEYIKG